MQREINSNSVQSYYFCNSIIVSAVNEREAQWQRTMYAALSWSTPLFPPLSFSCRF